MKACVLGAGGSFGLNVSRYLLREGHDVIGIGRAPQKPECFSLDLAKPTPRYQYHSYHITHELDLLMRFLDQEKPDLIVSFAAQGEGAASFDPRDYWRFFETNCTALVRLTGELSARPWMKRFIQIGTSELYGAVDTPADENAPIQASSPYSASKAAFDLHLKAIHRASGFPMNIIRPSNCYGPGQQLHRIVPKATLFALTGRKLPLHGGGRAEKSYLHSTDLSKAILLVAEQAPLGEIYNVGPDQPTSIREVVERCANACGVAFDELCEVTGDRIGQDSRYWLNAAKVKALGWKQSIGWDDGLADVREWAQRYKSELAAMPGDFRMRA